MIDVVAWVMMIVSIPFLYFCSGISLLCVLLAFILKASLEEKNQSTVEALSKGPASFVLNCP